MKAIIFNFMLSPFLLQFISKCKGQITMTILSQIFRKMKCTSKTKMSKLRPPTISVKQQRGRSYSSLRQITLLLIQFAIGTQEAGSQFVTVTVGQTQQWAVVGTNISIFCNYTLLNGNLRLEKSGSVSHVIIEYTKFSLITFPGPFKN